MEAGQPAGLLLLLLLLAGATAQVPFLACVRAWLTTKITERE